MPDNLPSDHLCARLSAEGIKAPNHNRRSLRYILLKALDAIPPDSRTTDELAEMVLTLARQGFFTGKAANDDNPVSD
jgi:hypothetical protein